MTGVQLGLDANRRQFWILVLVNAFVGAMVGLERTVLPLLAAEEFGLASRTAALSFLLTFGVVKAGTNLLAGRLGDRWGRRRILIAGWLFGLPVPLLLIAAPNWTWVLVANVLLGVNQGLAWSTTVIMKIDLVGPKRRGFAMGLNEFAGYVAVAVAALATGWVAEASGLRPEPFYLGIAFAAIGLGLSVMLVKETTGHMRLEARSGRSAPGPGLTARQVFARASWSDATLASVTQAGFVNNLNDGLAWGLLPLHFAAAGLPVSRIGVLGFLYPAVWGVLQLWTGALSDRIGRKHLISTGMLVQGAALALLAAGASFGVWALAAVMLGVGTAMVYPTMLAAIGDVAQPSWRGTAVGVYRFWRDSGYAAGALVAGLLADRFGMSAAIGAVGVLTAGSGVAVALRMPGQGSQSP